MEREEDTTQKRTIESAVISFRQFLLRWLRDFLHVMRGVQHDRSVCDAINEDGIENMDEDV